MPPNFLLPVQSSAPASRFRCPATHPAATPASQTTCSEWNSRLDLGTKIGQMAPSHRRLLCQPQVVTAPCPWLLKPNTDTILDFFLSHPVSDPKADCWLYLQNWSWFWPLQTTPTVILHWASFSATVNWISGLTPTLALPVVHSQHRNKAFVLKHSTYHMIPLLRVELLLIFFKNLLFLFFFNLFVWFLAMLRLCCCAVLFSSCSAQGPIAVASLEERGLQGP